MYVKDAYALARDSEGRSIGMKYARAVFSLVVGFCVLSAFFAITSGCGLQSLLIGNSESGKDDAPAGEPVAGRDGVDGLSCWDLDGDGLSDPEEDINADGVWDSLDCQGLAGAPGQDGAGGIDGADGMDGNTGLAGTSGEDGSDGLSCWDLNGNGLAETQEDLNADGVVDVFDCQGSTGPSGPTGETGTPGLPGPEGPVGPETFSTFVDDFFEADPEVPNEWPFLLAPAVNPVLGSSVREAIALPAVVFQVEVPETYDPAHRVALRVFFYRTGPMDEQCFVFAVEASRLRTALGIEGYGQRCWVQLDTGGESATDPVDSDAEVIGLHIVEFSVNDLPGLDYPPDLVPGDLLAFEFSGVIQDGGAYHLLGVEFFESVGAASDTGGGVFYEEEKVTCEFIDCNGNGERDDLEIVYGISGDCNNNDVPDDCDLCGTRIALAALGDAELPFTFLAPEFTQELYATSPDFMGGIAFAADGDVLVDTCLFDGSPLRRFDAQTTESVHGSSVHPLIATLASNAGCGLTNHPNETLYSNTAVGVTNLDPETGEELLISSGPSGNGLGIATDPQTSNIVYVGRDGRLLYVDPTLTTFGVFSTALEGETIQGIAFDVTGDYLFCANRTHEALTIIHRQPSAGPPNGEAVRTLPVFHNNTSHEPVAVGIHAAAPAFVVTLNVDGTMTRFDFPDGDYSRTPTQRLFASGGLRGDLSQVGPDGCLYVTQVGTQFADGTMSVGDSSVVRICGGFVPGPGVLPPIQLTPWGASSPVRTSHAVTATVSSNGVPATGLTVEFGVISGPNAGERGVSVTDAIGTATFTYVGDGGEGMDQIQASFEDETGVHFSNIATTTWVPLECSLDCNRNEIPDECELESNDCNGNEIPDQCDPDCDGDGVPDECDGGCDN